MTVFLKILLFFINTHLNSLVSCWCFACTCDYNSNKCARLHFFCKWHCRVMVAFDSQARGPGWIGNISVIVSTVMLVLHNSIDVKHDENKHEWQYYILSFSHCCYFLVCSNSDTFHAHQSICSLPSSMCSSLAMYIIT